MATVPRNHGQQRVTRSGSVADLRDRVRHNCLVAFEGETGKPWDPLLVVPVLRHQQSASAPVISNMAVLEGRAIEISQNVMRALQAAYELAEELVWKEDSDPVRYRRERRIARLSARFPCTAPLMACEGKGGLRPCTRNAAACVDGPGQQDWSCDDGSPLDEVEAVEWFVLHRLAAAYDLREESHWNPKLRFPVGPYYRSIANVDPAIWTSPLGSTWRNALVSLYWNDLTRIGFPPGGKPGERARRLALVSLLLAMPVTNQHHVSNSVTPAERIQDEARAILSAAKTLGLTGKKTSKKPARASR